MNGASLRFHEYVNDPIWGEIPVTKVEWDIINSTSFRRLQHIRQMGLAYLSFPTANHRRFEHSIGAMHVASLLFEILAELLQDMRRDIELKWQHLQAVRIAGLLHDIGHPPYSHAFEEAVSRNPGLVYFAFKSTFSGEYRGLGSLRNNPSAYKHELFTRHIITSDSHIAPILSRHIEKEGLFPLEEIALLATGDARYEGLSPFNMIISGDFDADRIDYICRDSYYCGFHQRFNIADLRRNIVLRSPADTGKTQILLKEDAIPAITTLIWYRYRLMKHVHDERTNRIATHMLVSMLASAYEETFGKLPKNAETEKTRIETLRKFHTEYSDEDCNNFLRETLKDKKVDDLLRGQISGQAIALGKRYLHPNEQYWVHSLSREPQRMSLVEEEYRKAIGEQSVYVDLRFPKPPQFTTLVQGDHDEAPRSVFDTFYAPHGVMIDTLNMLSCYIYSPDPNKFWRHTKTLGDAAQTEDFNHPGEQWRLKLYSVIQEQAQIGFRERSESKTVLPSDYLLIYMAVLEKLGQERLDRVLWAVGDGRLQKAIRFLIGKTQRYLSIVPPFSWTEENYSVDLFLTFEHLCAFGMIDHIHLPVGGPSPKKGLWMGHRIDRHISLFGRKYFNNYLLCSAPYTIIHRELTRVFDRCIEDFKEFKEIEDQLRKIVAPPSEVEEKRTRSADLRNKLSSNGFPVLAERRQ